MRSRSRIPIATTVFVGLEPDLGLDQDDAADDNFTAKQGGEVSLNIEPTDLGHVRVGCRPIGIGKTRPFDLEGRLHAHVEVDVAVDLDLAARGLFDLGSNLRLETVEIEKMKCGNGHHRYQQDNDDQANQKPDSSHNAPTRVTQPHEFLRWQTASAVFLTAAFP